ncbi:3-oxoacyl-[acyl-carrier-protein] reductase FabG [Candidatus Westeberhardia cardiocondylae]|uniref:3-oxoacyl-[acyl-carrier-protein] reductase n=1 Tax=Candidatus Westeberhardia cardiocondylae TaxID=1594731 RepID=A0A0H5C5F2_9ENTR|nr:3-oxoacyl-[acyl-carrier-protein] reductase [Candidatus Westeberhardia cardiocondylae]MCR3756439.1 3-oxoacyl-[acyl-carrier-protein] reductase FabG [Candidatus Westeberhardia cardiocondylae]CEN32181.1 3-oxoacyl-[acyl-carrier-protein] reductase FabG [Candidatus Westeberhardia cardiocondylae]
MSFKNKIVLVTGARKGIGYAITKIFLIKGAIVIGTSTDILRVEKINNYIKKYGKGKGMKLDISNVDSIDNFFKKIQRNFGKVDILINNAGILCDNLLINMKEKEWQSVINVNLTSIFRISKRVIRYMIKQCYGRIITIGSVIGSIGNIGQTNYSAAKAGLIGFSKSLAKEVAHKGITVNVIAPGFIITNMTKSLSNKQRAKILSKIPIKRFGNIKDIANIVAFFASEKASYITGETIHVNGGMYMP